MQTDFTKKECERMNLTQNKPYPTRWYFISEINEMEYEQYGKKLIYMELGWLNEFCKCRKIGTYKIIFSDKTEQKFYFNGVNFRYVNKSHRKRDKEHIKQLPKIYNLSEKEFFELSNIPPKLISYKQLRAICEYMRIIRPKIGSDKYFNYGEKYLSKYYASKNFYRAYHNYYGYIKYSNV